MIDFTFTDEQEMFRKASREFAENRVAPFVPEMEKSGRDRLSWLKRWVMRKCWQSRSRKNMADWAWLCRKDDCARGDQPDFRGHSNDASGFCPGD